MYHSGWVCPIGLIFSGQKPHIIKLYTHCKEFYSKLICNEIGLSLTNDKVITNSDTYEIVDQPPAHHITRLKKESQTLGIQPDESNLNLAYLYLLPKFHKNPIKFRPIVASTRSVTKELSYKLSIALKLIQNRLKNYCNTITKCTRINPYWIIKNNKPILDTLSKISKQRNAKSINTYDFTTLYTSINHDDLLSALTYIIDLAYKSSRHTNITIYNKSAKWANSTNSRLSVTKDDLMIWTKFLIANTFIQIGNIVIRQKKGIPMGTNAAPQIADLYLLAQEIKFIKNNMRINYSNCFNLRYTYRYLDDITIINDNETFVKEIENIYDTALTLVKVNQNHLNADVLDISITIKDRQFISSLYDKRNDFNFKVNRLPASDSNISTQTMYNVFLSQLIRFGRICSTKELFIINCQNLIKFLREKNYSTRRLRETFLTFLRKNNTITQKFEISNHIDLWLLCTAHN